MSLACLSALLAFSCSDEDTGVIDSNRVAVLFGSGNIASPKTTADGNQWTAGDKVGIFMVKHGESLSAGAISENGNNVEYKAEVGNSTNSTFAPVGGAIYYPQNGDKVDFIAYHPYKPGLISPYRFEVDVSNQESPAGIDYLYAYTNPDGAALGYNKNSGTVDLQFGHVMSKMNFTLMAGKSIKDEALQGLKIEITDAYSKGIFDLPAKKIISPSGIETIEANTAANGLSSSAIMIPQDLNTSKLKITLAGGQRTFEWSFPSVTLLPGKIHNYVITVDEKMIFSIGDITDWTGKDDPPTVGGVGIYKEGDYYPDPNVVYDSNSPGTVLSGTAALGIVIEIDSMDNRHGKVLGLKQYLGRWGPVVDENAAGVEYVRNSNQGKIMTRSLITIRKDQPNFATEYPIFYWIYHTLNMDDIDGKWFMPSFNEMHAVGGIYKNVTIDVNNKLKAAGGDLLRTDRFYWNTRELFLYDAYYYSFTNFKCLNTEKYRELYSCCLMEF